MNNERTRTAVIKVGTSLATHEDDSLNYKFIDELTRQLYEAYSWYDRIILVTSGAVAAGRAELNSDNGNGVSIPKQQVESAVGMYQIMTAYFESFRALYCEAVAKSKDGEDIEIRRIIPAQILVTKKELQESDTKLCIEQTLERCFADTRAKVLPIVNENDTVAVAELMTDNDLLAGDIARLVRAEVLILLTDVPGIQEDINDPAKVIPQFAPGSREYEQYMVHDCTKGRSRGSMNSKGQVGAELSPKPDSIRVVIAHGNRPNVIRNILDPDQGDYGGTEFLPEK